MENIQKVLSITAVVFLLMSLIWNMYPQFPRLFWDININKPGIQIYIPVVSALLLGALLTYFSTFFRI